MCLFSIYEDSYKNMLSVHFWLDVYIVCVDFKFVCGRRIPVHLTSSWHDSRSMGFMSLYIDKIFICQNTLTKKSCFTRTLGVDISPKLINIWIWISKAVRHFNEMGDFDLDTNCWCIFWESFKFKGQTNKIPIKANFFTTYPEKFDLSVVSLQNSVISYRLLFELWPDEDIARNAIHR